MVFMIPDSQIVLYIGATFLLKMVNRGINCGERFAGE